jgi:diacylglycerol kinase family enzyme
MQRVALIYNPASGQHSASRKAAVQEALAVLSEAGIAAEAFVTDGAGSATVQALEAIRQGCDTVLACGGDGTVHEVLQSLVGTDVALGVIPLGTANALAANLGLIATPAKVVRMLLDAPPMNISVGRIHYQTKRRLGYVLYLIEAFRIWATHSFPLFEIVLPANGSGTSGNGRTVEVSQLLVVRVRSFGGVLRYLAPGASVRNGNLSLLAFKTRSRFRYMLFLLAVVAGRHTFAREVELIESPSVECHARNGSKDSLFVEADGEVLGLLPVKIEVVPDALNLLVPRGAKP